MLNPHNSAPELSLSLSLSLSLLAHLAGSIFLREISKILGEMGRNRIYHISLSTFSRNQERKRDFLLSFFLRLFVGEIRRKVEKQTDV
jgi:hypothetical protein